MREESRPNGTLLISVSSAICALALPGPARCQEAPVLDTDQVLDYGWLYSRSGRRRSLLGREPGRAEHQRPQHPISFWMRRLPCCGNPVTPESEGRTFGVRLRITGVIGFCPVRQHLGVRPSRASTSERFSRASSSSSRRGRRSMLRPLPSTSAGPRRARARQTSCSESWGCVPSSSFRGGAGARTGAPVERRIQFHRYRGCGPQPRHDLEQGGRAVSTRLHDTRSDS